MEDLTLHSAHFEDGAIDMRLSGEQASIFMASLVQLFKQNGGENFLTVTVEGQGEKYAITIQDCSKTLTPAEKLAEMKQENEELKKRLEQAQQDGFGEEWV